MKFQIDEIARIFRVPPHMIGDLEKSSFNNIEQQSLEFVKYTLDPWVSRWEQAMVRALLTPDEKMICHDCGGLMYCHRTSNGKKVAQYVCAKYGKQPVGTYCSSGHRINADAVIEIVRDTLRYLKNTIEDNPEEFIEQITQHEADNRNAEAKKKQERLKVCRSRMDDLERLICKIYEDHALGKMPESRYETLITQYSKEKGELKEKIDRIEDFLSEIEANRKSGKRFVDLMSR